ncbi:MAG TPA: GGDEF domain-containing protein [Rhodocyclaceae bacterium]
MDESARHRFEELKAGGQLPSPRGVALAVMDIVRHPDAKIRDIARLVQTDPAMTGRILRYANAGRIGSRPIVSLGQAITFLGLYRVRQIALGFSLIDEYRSGACRAFDYERYWGASLATAIAAQKLSSIAQTPPDESFTCGLLAGIGRLAFATVFPGDYAEILQRHPGAEQLLKAEKQRFGLDHAELSAEMVTSWGIPPVFAQAVQYHEAPLSDPSNPGTRARTLTAVLHFAARIGRLLNPADGDAAQEASAMFDTAAQLGIESGEVRPLVEGITADWTDWMQELALRGRPPAPLGDLLETAARPRTGAEAGGSALARMRVAVLVRDAHCRARLAAMLDALKVSFAIHETVGAIDGTAEDAPQLVFVDAGREERLDELERAVAADLPVVVVIPPAAESDFPRLMAMGAMDYLVGDFTESALIARLMSAHRLAALRSTIRAERESSRQWAQANRRLLHDALTDPLTQLPNRRYGMDRFTEEWSIAADSELPIACMMLDIDHFKRINDRHGHDVGDRVLFQLARTMEGGTRRSDILFRYGGEEFCCVCPGTGMAEAEHLAQRLIEAVRAARFGPDDKPFRVTLSIGLAVRGDKMRQPADLIAVADKALYQAKEGGRDRIVSR